MGSQKYKSLQNIAVMISELPKNVSFMLRNKILNLNLGINKKYFFKYSNLFFPLVESSYLILMIF